MVRTKRAKVLSILVTLSMLASMFVMPLAASAAVPASNVGVTYQAQVQRYGWMDSASNGELAGTVGQALRMEAVKISLTGAPAGASIIYQTHVQSKGWMDAVADGAIGGTVGLAKRVEAFRMTLSGLPGYEVQYEVQGQTYGWSQGWLTAANGTAIADAPVVGTTGQAKRIEALKIKVVKTAAEVAAETAADAAVTKAEASKTQADIDAAKTAIASVLDTVAKDAFTARANAIVVPPAATVSSIAAVSVSTVAGTAPKLPATVTVAMSDGSSKSVNVTWAAVDASKYAADGSFTVSGTIAESATLKATATVTVDTTAVSVAPVSSSISINATTAFKFVDGDGKTVTPANADFSITSKNSATGFFNGSGVFSASAAGVYAIQVVIGSKKVTTSVTVYGAASNLVISKTSTLVGNGVSTESLTVTAVDALGSTAQNFTGKVSVYLGNSLKFDGTTTSPITAVNGVVSFTIKSNGQLTSAIAEQISAATTGGITGDLTTVSLTVPKPTSVKLSIPLSSTAEAAPNSSVPVTGTLYDETGTIITSTAGQLNIPLTSSDINKATVTGTLIIAQNANSGPATVSYVAPGTISVTPGQVTIGGTNVSVSVNTLSVTFAASANASKLVLVTAPEASFIANKQQSVSVLVTDASGIIKTTWAQAALTLTIKDGNGTVVSQQAVGCSQGLAKFDFTINTAGSYTYAITAPDDQHISPVSGSFTINPAAATHLHAVSASPDTIRADGVSTSTLKVTAYDNWDNIATTSSLAVTFAKDADNKATTLPSTTTVNTVNGVASIVVTSTTKYIDANTLLADTFKATTKISDNDVTSSGNATVNTEYTKTATQLVITRTNANLQQSVKADSNFTVSVNILDAYGSRVKSDNNSTVSVAIVDASGAIVGSGSGTAVDGIASVKVSVTKTGTYSKVTASCGSLTSDSVTTYTDNNVNQNVTMIVSAANAVALTLTPTLTSAAPKTSIGFTVGTVDKYGNAASNLNNTSVTITANSDTYGSFGGSKTLTVSLNNGTFTASKAWYISNTTAYGSTSFTVSIGDSSLTSASSTVTSVYTQDPRSVVASGASTVNAGSDQTVTFRIVDVNGNVITTLDNLGVTLTIEAVTGTYNPATVSVASTYSLSNGTVSFKINDTVAQQLKYTLTYVDANVGTIKGSVSGTFTPGAAAKILMSDTGNHQLLSDGSSIINVTATLADQYNNVVGTGNGSVTFSVTKDGDVARATILNSATVTFVNGSAMVTIQSVASKPSFDVTAKTTIGTTDVTATDPISYK